MLLQRRHYQKLRRQLHRIIFSVLQVEYLIFHRFQVIGDTKLSVSASSIGIESGLKVVSLGAVEIGFQVTNTAITIGDAGTMQIPYIQDSTNAPSDSVVDGWFGDANGCIGIQYYNGVPDNHRFWFKSDGGWVKTFGT